MQILWLFIKSWRDKWIPQGETEAVNNCPQSERHIKGAAQGYPEKGLAASKKRAETKEKIKAKVKGKAEEAVRKLFKSVYNFGSFLWFLYIKFQLNSDFLLLNQLELNIKFAQKTH